MVFLPPAPSSGNSVAKRKLLPTQALRWLLRLLLSASVGQRGGNAPISTPFAGYNRKYDMRPLALALILLAPAIAQTPRPMTPDDVLNIKSVGGAEISPDGQLVLYEVSYADLGDDRRRTEIWLAPATGAPAQSKARKFTSGHNDRSPEWSPDGQSVAFLRTARENGAAASEPPRAQIYLMPAFGGEADPLTDAKGGVTSFAWSPDSKRIAFVAGVPLTEAQEKDQKDKNDARVIDGEYRFSHLWVIDAASKKTAEIVKSDGVLADPQWSPDGSHLAYVSRPTPKADDGSESDIYVAAADGSGAPHKLIDNAGPDDSPRWSPDGKWIAFNSRDTHYGVLGIQHLMVTAASGGTPRDLTPDPAAGASDIRWSPDGSSLYFRSSLHSTSQIFRVPIKGGAAEALTRDQGVINSFSLSRSADRVAFTRSDVQHAPDLYVSAFPKLDPQRVTDHNPLVRELALGKSEVIRWHGKDGLDVEGILIYPVGYQPGQKVPLVASIHGGPSGVWSQAFPGSGNNYPHVWAGKGWAVFLPNIRGSSGYGEKFQMANYKDWGGRDFRTSRPGLDELVRRGIADPIDGPERLELRRLHDRLDADPNQPLQSRHGRRRPDRHVLDVLHQRSAARAGRILRRRRPGTI